MSIVIPVEERLAAVEAAVARLQQRLDPPPASDWLARLVGSVGDDPAFDEVLAYGRAYRAGSDPVAGP